MKNISNKTFRELSSSYFTEVFRIIDKVCLNLGITYYLIGAHARNFHLLENGIAPNRGTQDIDFAVMLPEMKKYNEMIDKLIENGFRKVNEPYRLIYDQTNTVIDLLPFGEIEEEGTVTFIEREIELSVIGMKEIKEHTVNMQLEELTIKVSPLEGIVILKLISYTEKKVRTKDLDDISEILSNYFEINSERFYKDHIDVTEGIPNENFIQLAGARLMGRDMKKILAHSEKLSQQIKTTIQNELGEKTGSITQYFLSKNIFKNYNLIKNIFTELLKGIND